MQVIYPDTAHRSFTSFARSNARSISRRGSYCIFAISARTLAGALIRFAEVFPDQEIAAFGDATIDWYHQHDFASQNFPENSPRTPALRVSLR